MIIKNTIGRARVTSAVLAAGSLLLTGACVRPAAAADAQVSQPGAAQISSTGAQQLSPSRARDANADWFSQDSLDADLLRSKIASFIEIPFSHPETQNYPAPKELRWSPDVKRGRVETLHHGRIAVAGWRLYKTPQSGKMAILFASGSRVDKPDTDIPHGQYLFKNEPLALLDDRTGLQDNQILYTLVGADAAGKPVVAGQTLVTVLGQREENGITVGKAKLFDQQSLLGMVQSLNGQLQLLRQPDAGNLYSQVGNVNGASSSSSNTEIDATVASGRTPPGAPGLPATNGASTGTTISGATPSFNISALDTLQEQTDLTFQLFNLRLLLERSLSDRLYGFDSGSNKLQPRGQAVVGFQISVDALQRYKNAIAQVDVTLRTSEVETPAAADSHGTISLSSSTSGQPDKAATDSQADLSLVSLMPDRNSYNVAQYTQSSNVVKLGAVAQLIGFGGGKTGGNSQLYLVKDTDTVALEMIPTNANSVIDSKSLSFGWQFRPVLAQEAVSPGTRQVYAVIALPTTTEGSWRGKAVVHTYWRHFDARTKTAGSAIEGSDSIQELNPIIVPSKAALKAGMSQLTENSDPISSVEILPTAEAGKSTVIITGNGFSSDAHAFIGTDSYANAVASSNNPHLFMFTTDTSKLTGKLAIWWPDGRSAIVMLPCAKKT